MPGRTAVAQAVSRRGTDFAGDLFVKVGELDIHAAAVDCENISENRIRIISIGHRKTVGTRPDKTALGIPVALCRQFETDDASVGVAGQTNLI